MNDLECPMKMNKENNEDWWCTKEKCGWYFKSAKMCSMVMIANGACKDMRYLRSESKEKQQ